MSNIARTAKCILFWMLLCVSVLYQSVFAQNPTLGKLTVTGLVQDEDGYSMPGVCVQLKGTNLGTSTGTSGEYSVEVLPEDVLVFTFMGMETQEIPVNGRTIIDVTLKADAVVLDEVVAIGYGKSSRSLLTNSITKVSSSDIWSARSNI